MTKTEKLKEWKEIKKIEDGGLEDDIRLSRSVAFGRTKGKEGKHKYCKNCYACYYNTTCIATPRERYNHACLRAMNKTLLKEGGIYGQIITRNS